MDGAMGTMIQSHKLQEEDFRGKVITITLFVLQYNCVLVDPRWQLNVILVG